MRQKIMIFSFISVASAQGAEPVVPTEAPHHGPGAAYARGAEQVVPTEAPQRGPGRRRPLRKFCKGIGDR